MSNLEVICFKDFLSWHRRSGGALVAESDVLNKLEDRFGRFYVSHVADRYILHDLFDMAKKEEVFLMVIIGVPGVGKTKLLKELIDGIEPEHFEPRDMDIITKVRDTFEFLDAEKLEPGKKRLTPKRKVWVTLNIDGFVSVGEGTNPLLDLYGKLKAGLYRGESLIICGNIGVLDNEEAKNSIEEIRKLMDLRNIRKVKTARFPREPLYWTKEYGIHMKKRYGIEVDPYFLTSGYEGFQKYSLELIQLSCNVLKKCILNARRPECRGCVGPIYFNYIKELRELLGSEDFINRLHDLLQFLWLRYRDFYLVARTINIFWGYALTELWKLVEKHRSDISGTIGRSMIYHSIYSSKLPSIYYISEYPLADAGIHKLRDKVFEQSLLSSCHPLLRDPNYRLRKRLEYFFEGLKKSEYRGKISGGVFEEYMEGDRLSTCLTDITRKLILMRLDKSLVYIPESDKRFQEIYREPWGFERLLFASKVIGSQSIEPNKRIKVPLLIFNESVLNDVAIHSGIAFEEIQHPSYYLAHREKILRLKLRLGENVPKDLQSKAPRFHLSLNDYASLRNLTGGVGRPDISLYRSTEVKVISFLDEVEGFVTHEIRPILWKYLREDIKKGDTSRVLVRTLGPNTRRCEVKIDGEYIVVEKEGMGLLRCSMEGFQ